MMPRGHPPATHRGILPPYFLFFASSSFVFPSDSAVPACLFLGVFLARAWHRLSRTFALALALVVPNADVLGDVDRELATCVRGRHFCSGFAGRAAVIYARCYVYALVDPVYRDAGIDIKYLRFRLRGCMTMWCRRAVCCRRFFAFVAGLS